MNIAKDYMKEMLKNLFVKKLDYKARGYRDLYWCWNFNEPFIVTYKDYKKNPSKKRFCRNCRQVFFNEKKHIFIAHIYKPRWHYIYQPFIEYLKAKYLCKLLKTI